ncbi:MAG TPA: hypothetical protein VHL58_19675 [Thermoanaerobaculia bacterium]|nr:hypothetical protein [Thermoanaerobaculia bacterium]
MEVTCTNCGTEKKTAEAVCTKCGSLGPDEHRGGSRNTVRDEDLEPYIALRYIAKLFKVLAVLMFVMMVAEIVTGLMTAGLSALRTLLSETTQLLVFSGLMWGAGDLAILLIDAGHDLRVARILLGRINARLHETGPGESKAP